MTQPIDLRRERRRRKPPRPPLSAWLWRVVIVAAAIYALVRAWQVAHGRLL